MRHRTLVLPSIAIALLLLIAAGGYFIVPGNPIFWCGRVEAYPSLYVIDAAVLIQTALFLSGAATVYRVTQYLAAPFVLLALAQLAGAYPLTFLAFSLLAVTIAFIFRLFSAQFGTHDIAARTALAITCCVGLAAAATQIPLFSPHQLLSNGFIAICLPGAFVASIWMIGKAPAQTDAGTPFLVRCLPLTLLLLPVLRAKVADTAFDSFLYKATQPYLIAEWRTGRPGIIDAFMVGTNFQEVINADLIILLHDYTPALLSMIAYLLLFFSIPYATQSTPSAGRTGRCIAGFAGLSMFVLPQAAIDQGTAYQEPSMLLLLAAALASSMAWPAFLAMAAGVKITAVFVAPLIVLLHVCRPRFAAPRWRAVLIGCLFGLLVIGPQFGRNVALTGRLFALNETLVSLTDPPGSARIMVPGTTKYDGGVRGGPANNALLSACNMFLLADLCPTAYEGLQNDGFMVFPASRAPLFAIVVGILLLARFPRTARARLRLLASSALLLLCYALTMKYLSEGRYFLPLAFGFSVFLLVNAPAFRSLLDPDHGPAWSAVLLCTGIIMIGSELIPGTFTNAGWACQRDFAGSVQAQPVTSPSTPVEKFVASYVAQYKQSCPAPGVPPVILAEHDSLNAPYLGAEVVGHIYAHEMNRRFYAADPSRQPRLASAALMTVYQHDPVQTVLLGPALKDFQQCFQADEMTVLCSTVLPPIGTSCAQPLFPQP